MVIFQKLHHHFSESQLVQAEQRCYFLRRQVKILTRHRPPANGNCVSSEIKVLKLWFLVVGALLTPPCCVSRAMSA